MLEQSSYLHLDVEVPLHVQLLHLEVEGDVLELEQAGPPERPAVMVIQSPGVLYLLLIKQTGILEVRDHVRGSQYVADASSLMPECVFMA